MVRRTPRDLGQPHVVSQRSIKLIALPLGAVVLPVGPVGVAQRALELLLEPALGRLARHGAEQRLGVAAPKDAPVLLAGPAHAADAVQGRLVVVDEAREHQVKRLEPHGHGGKDLALGLVDEHALGEAILAAKVCVKVDLGF